MTTHEVCPMWASEFIVLSATSDDKSYLVKFFPTQKAVCSCPAYRYSGEYDDQTCKHIRMVKSYGCFYMPYYSEGIKNMLQTGHNDLETAGITLLSTTKKNVVEDKPCPACQRPMIEVTV